MLENKNSNSIHSNQKGVYEKKIIPDTFDIRDMAEKSIHVMTSSTDPDCDFDMYFKVLLKTNPIRMIHSPDDHCHSKFMEAVQLLRYVTGSEENLLVEKTWFDTILKNKWDDGLAGISTFNRPWMVHDDGYGTKKSDFVEQRRISPAYLGRLISSLVFKYRTTGELIWKETAIGIVDSLKTIAIYKEDYAYFSPSPVMAVKGSTRDEGGIKFPVLGAAVSQVILGLVHLYREFKYEPAVNLSLKLLNYIFKQCDYFGIDGSFNKCYPQKYGNAGHIHGHTYCLIAMLELADIKNDYEMKEFVKKSYEWARTKGNSLIGYFGEYLNSDEYEETEICGVADMITLAVKLCVYGIGDYWDDVDRWVRNIFYEGQLTIEKIPYMNKMSANFPFNEKYQSSKDSIECNFKDYSEDDVLNRNIGAFAGWMEPNDFFNYESKDAYGIMHCCTANASRSLYYIWKDMHQCEEGVIRINLLINMDSKFAEVESYIPYDGKVTITPKLDCTLEIRLPEWITDTNQVNTSMKGVTVKFSQQGRYIIINNIKNGTNIDFFFPIEIKEIVQWIEKRRFEFTMKGNDIVSVKPRGRFIPIFEREKYLSNNTPMKEKEVYIADDRFIY